MKRDRARRLYRAMTLAAPEVLRRRHGREMELLFLERLSSAEGVVGRGRVWMAAALDLVGARWRGSTDLRSAQPSIRTERRPSMIGSDLRYTVRWLLRQKISTAAVAAMLALGIGANVVVFSLVNALILRPVPFPEPDRLVYINETAPKWNLEVVNINFPDFHQWKQSVRLFEAIAIWDSIALNLSDGSSAERIEGLRVTSDYARVLGIEAILGRMFSPEEDRPKAPRVAVIVEGLWKERFGGRNDVLGRTMKLNGVQHTIVGVMPEIGSFPGRVRLWVPFAGDPNQTSQNYGAEGLGRMKPGVTVEAATSDLHRAHEPIWTARDKDRVVSPFARPLQTQLSERFNTAASALLVAAALLLVVTCANVASIMLARALARRREMAIRLAVGASRPRIARQLLLESLVLASLGGIAGLILGRWALQILIAGAGDLLPSWAVFELDVRVVAFSLAVTMLTALLFGLMPALHAIRSTVRSAMAETAAGSTSAPGGRRTLSVLVSAEFALAAILLICGGLLFRAYDRVRQVDSGFNPQRVLTFSLALPEAVYPDDPKRLAFWNRLRTTFAALPGVEASGVVSCAPLGCHWGTFYDIEGRAPGAPGQPNPVTLFRPASPDYFRAMGIRLKTGRFFDEEDGREGNLAIIVNETFVKTFWPGVTDPVGRRIRHRGGKAPWMRVVGMVEDARHYGLERPMRPAVYVPLRQFPADTLTVVVKTAGDPASFTPTARNAVRELDPELPLYQVRTMEEALARSMAQRSLYSWLLGVFASLAVVMALGGTYGVTAYLVSQRTREIGIRVALGARTADITRAVLGRSLGIVGAGLVVGAGASLAVARLISDLLFGVPPHDSGVLAFAAGLLAITAGGANYLSARRASRVDPARTLRAE